MLGKPESAAPAARPDPEAVTPEAIVEALLFVGHADGSPVSAEEIAAAIRDHAPEEIPPLVERVDAAYEARGAGLRVERSAGGWRLAAADGLERVADRLAGRVKAARLSQPALETLSVVAYRQPISEAEVTDLRGASSAGLLRRLVRQGLLRTDPAEADGAPPRYATTDRFLRTVGLASLGDLPRVAELDE